MKKHISVFLIAAIVLAMAAGVFAEDSSGRKESANREDSSNRKVSVNTEELITLSIADMDADLYDGAWVTVADLFELYVPADWFDKVPEKEATAEYRFFDTLSSPEGNMYAGVLGFDTSQFDNAFTGDTSVADLYTYICGAGYTQVKIADLNSIDCVMYADPEAETINICTTLSDGTLCMFMFYGFSDENSIAILTNIMYSLSILSVQ